MRYLNTPAYRRKVQHDNFHFQLIYYHLILCICEIQNITP